MSPKERYPEWLASLQGDSPLLERSKWDYINDVRSLIKEEAQYRPEFPCEKDLKLKNKLSVLKNNFEKVVKYLKENSRSRGYFLRTYPEWRTVRNQTISQVKEIARSVNTDSQNCSVSRGVGSTVSFIGGLMCLAGGSGASRIVGSVLMGLGSATSAGTSSVELALLRKKVKEAEKIIEEDREYSEKLWHWISDVSSIEEALSIIRNIDVDVNLKKAANELHVNYKKKSEPKEQVMSIIKAVKCLNISPDIMNEVSDVVGILLSISMLYDSYRPLFHNAFEAYKCNKTLSTACNIIVSTLRMKAAFSASKSSELTTLQKSKIVSGMALDAMSILLATEGASSTSKQAGDIIKAADKLKEEAETYKKLYDAVKYL